MSDCNCGCDCNCSAVIQKGDIGPKGDTGKNGDYGGFSRMWKFDTVTLANPASTYLRLNSNVFSTTTTIYVNTTDVGANASGFLNAIENSGNYGLVKLFKEYDSNKYALFNVTNYTLVGSYVSLTVIYEGSNGSFSANDDIVLSFTPRGPIITNYLYTLSRFPSIPQSSGSKISLGTKLIALGSPVVEEDPMNAYNPTTGLWTSPKNGYYDISFVVGFAVQPDPEIFPFQGGTGYILGGITDNVGNNVYCSDMVLIDSTGATAPDQIVVSSSSIMRKLPASSTLCVRIFNKTGGIINTNNNSVFILNIKLVQTY